jgi:hypothetical protein
VRDRLPVRERRALPGAAAAEPPGCEVVRDVPEDRAARGLLADDEAVLPHEADRLLAVVAGAA